MRNQGLRFFIVTLVMLLAAITVEGFQENPTVQKDESLRRGEMRATLDPGLFQDSRVRSAYQIARDVPWLLDSIYCYCYCEESFRHKSLLSCYVDNHAAMWEICLGEAGRAFELYKKGYPIKKIKETVEQEYKRWEVLNEKK